MIPDDANPRPSGTMQSTVPANVSGSSPVAAMSPPTVWQPSISSEEADRRRKEAEKQRAPRIAVVPNLAHIVQDDPSVSYPQVSPRGPRQHVVGTRPPATTIAPPKATLRLAPAVPLPLHQEDKIKKQRERNARPTAVVPNQAEDLLRARFEAATLAMPENIKQEDFNQVLNDERQHQTTYQTYRQQRESVDYVVGQGSSEMGRRKRPSNNINGRAQTTLDPAPPHQDLTPGALAVSDGIAQRLNKAALTRVETASPPDYVTPTGRDAFEGPRTPGIYGTLEPSDQQIPIAEGSDPAIQQGQRVMTTNTMEYKTLSRRKWYMIGAVVLIMIIVIAVSVAVTVGGKSNDETAETTDESEGSTNETERHISLRKALEALSVSSMEQLTDRNEAQYLALTWLADVDTDTVIEDPLTMTQRYVLAVFYYSMNGPAWTNATDWLNPSKNECEWIRISCETGQVSSITEIFPVNMEGVLPTELNALPLLKNLVIAKNHVRGFAGPLSVLTELSLNEASLGEIFKDIPTTILEMTNLQGLSLSNNGFIGTIPTEIEKLTSLESLSLASNSLIGTIPTEIEKLTSLDTLNLSYNKLTGTLPTQLISLRNLTAFSVMENQFSGDVLRIIGGLSNLSQFSGSFNRFTGTIGTEIATLSNLAYFAMRQNNLGGSFPNFMFNISSLAVLDLTSNQLTGTLSSAIGELAKLQELHLSHTRVSGSIPTEIGRASQLYYLQAENCSMVGDIPTEIGVLTSMTWLKLSNNTLDGTIPTELGNLVSLQSLHLDGNLLKGPIPSQLGQLSALSSFMLVNNELSGNLPSEVCAISSLSSVSLVGAFPRDGLSCGDCAKCI